MTGNVLDLIDNVVAEHELPSADAMRWAPDAPEPGCAWDAMVRERFGPVFDRFGVVLTDWQYEVIGRTFKVPVQMLLSRPEVERRVRLRHLHSDYRRRNRGR